MVIVPVVSPCPFCGSTAIRDSHDDGQHWKRCSNCGTNGPINTRYSGEEGEPCVDWNTRATGGSHE